MVRDTYSSANGASFKLKTNTRSPGKCYAEFNMNKIKTNEKYSSCMFFPDDQILPEEEEEHPSVYREDCDSKIASNFTSSKYVGGTLYVTKANYPSEWTHVIDLADAAMEAGCVPKHKPHMAVPSPNGSYAAISYTGDKFVHIMDTETKQIVMCIDSTAPAAGVVGGAMHTVAWFGDDNLLLCDMTGSVNGVGGGAIHKFSVDLNRRTSKYVNSASMGLRQEFRNTSATKPISLGNNPHGDSKHLFFVTDAKGGASILNATTMAVVKDFTTGEMAPCAGGGLWVEPHPEDPSVVVAQYGSQDSPDKKTAECLYKVNLTDLSLTTFLLPDGADDAHSVQFCKGEEDKYFLINTNRVSATLDVLDYETGDIIVENFDLNSPFEQQLLQPDVGYLAGQKLFLAARGPAPVSAVKAQNFGVFFLDMNNCVDPQIQDKLTTLLSLSLGLPKSYNYNLETEADRSIIPSDVNGIWGINDEIWVVDQAGTGSVQTYQVYSRCAAYEA